MTFPDGFDRIPDAPWTEAKLGDLALKYDTVESHGWYANLDPSVETLVERLSRGGLLIDYSGGTGIFAERLLPRLDEASILIADASPKFLRVALNKLGDDNRVGFRLIQYIKPEKRLLLLDEVVGDLRADGISSTNAVHLYYDLDDTLKAWWRVLKPGGFVHVQSGNLGNPAMADDEWIIDATVHAIHAAAVEIVQRDARWSQFAAVLEDPERMARYDRLRNKFFLPVRPLKTYLDALQAAGFVDLDVTQHRIEAKVEEWYRFLAVYHEGVLGWAGGSRRVEGDDPDEETVTARKALIREAMDAVFEGAETFPCCWTYIDGVRP